MSTTVQCSACRTELEVVGTPPARCPVCQAPVEAQREPGAAPPPPCAELRCVRHGVIIAIPARASVTIGREWVGRDELERMGREVSRVHCHLVRYEDAYLVVDASSTRGTFVGSAKRECMTRALRIDHGDALWLGQEEFTFHRLDRSPVRPIRPAAAAPPVAATHQTQTHPAMPPPTCGNCGQPRAPGASKCGACGEYFGVP